MYDVSISIQVTESVDGILTAQTASTTDAIVAWEGDKRMVI